MARWQEPEPKSQLIGRLEDRVGGGALCTSSGVDPDDWYPVGKGTEVHATPDEVASVWEGQPRARAARWTCGRCPVRAECLALSFELPAGAHGIWAGMLPAERRDLRLAQIAESVKPAEVSGAGVAA